MPWVTARLGRTVCGRLCCVVGGTGSVPPVKMYNLMDRKGHSHFLCGYSKATEWILDQKMSFVNIHLGDNEPCAIMGFTSSDFGLWGEMDNQLWQKYNMKVAAMLFILVTLTDNSFDLIFQNPFILFAIGAFHDIHSGTLGAANSLFYCPFPTDTF